MLNDEIPFAGTRLTFVHTLPALQPTFEALVAEHLPGAEAHHVIDAGFYDAEFERGALDDEEQQRLVGYLNDASTGSDMAIVTCSFLGTYIDELGQQATKPWQRVDEPMGRAALERGDRIGVLATGAPAADSTRGLLERLADEAGRDIRIEVRLEPDAFDARLAGDLDMHDALIAAQLEALQELVDVIVLSQASTARAIEAMDAAPKVPVLTSPGLLFAHLRERLQA